MNAVPRVLWAIGLVALALLAVEAVWLDLYNEEPRRIMVAQTMLEDGLSAAPSILGDPYLKKPPGYNWALAIVSLPFGEVSAVTARSFSLAVWLALGTLLAWIARREVSVRGRAVAVMALLLGGIVLIEKAALAEIDLFFTLVLLAGSGMWFELSERGRPHLAWIVAHLFLALALLTKGPLAYPFFYVPTLGLVIWDAFSPSRESRRPGIFGLVAGVALAHGAVALWLMSLLNESGITLEEYRAVIAGDSVGRRHMVTPLGYLQQVLFAPLRLWAALLPFSVLALPLFHRETRGKIFSCVTGSSLFRFALLGLPPMMMVLFPASRVRYVLPAFPAAALLLGMLADELDEKVASRWLRRVLIVAAVLLILCSALPWVVEEEGSLLSPGAQVGAAIGFVFAGAVLLALCVLPGFNFGRGLAGLALWAVLLKAGYLFAYIPQRRAENVNTETHVGQWATELRTRGIETVVCDSPNLAVCYYLARHGVEMVGASQAGPGRWVLSLSEPPQPSEVFDELGTGPVWLYRLPDAR